MSPRKTPPTQQKRPTPSSAGKRPYLTQSEVPSRTLREALKVPEAIIDNYAGVPTAPHDIALALEMSPTSSGWRDLAAAAAGYGLSKGSWSANKISVSDLGRRAVAPLNEGQDLQARAEAALTPKVFGAFFRRYNKNKFPPDHIAKNVLHQEYGVPQERAENVLRIIRDNGRFVGFVRDTKTGPFVAIDEPAIARTSGAADEADSTPNGLTETTGQSETSAAGSVADQAGILRVFISHGRNKALVDQVKDILALYDIPFEAAVEAESTANPVPDKVVAAMRRCQAGIMIVSGDERGGSSEDLPININVLIEIGAAFVLYDKRVVLLWDKRLKVPPNLQALHRLEFEGTELSFGVGTRLAKTIKNLREQP